MTGIRHTDVKGISSGNPVSPPPVTCGDSPVGACGSASLRRHLRCFGAALLGPFRNPVSPPPVTCVTAPSGHAAPLRYAGTCAASVSFRKPS